MAGTMKTEGMAEISRMLNQMGNEAQKAASMGLYEGAGVMADEVQKGADSIQTAPFHYAVFITRQPSPEEKAVVQSGAVGIAKFQKSGGEVNTSVGYAKAGYAELNGKTVPIAKIVNAINSGTSFMAKQPFFRKAVNAGKKKAEAAISGKIESMLNEMIKK